MKTCFSAKLLGLLQCFLDCVAAANGAEQSASLFEQQTLFRAGDHGYQCYRIPALVVTGKGAILAFAEASKSSCSDHGDIDLVLTDECDVVELQDGALYLNARSRQNRKRRAYSFSEDGGETWSPVKYDRGMPEPSCQGSIVRLTDSRRFDKSRILMAAPANPTARTTITVRLSYDECRTWPVSKVLYDGSAAYSDLAAAKDDYILCLYEADRYSKIVLARFNTEWLTDGED